MIRTKIIVTIGPASNDEAIIRSFLREGVAGFRINFSHGDTDTWDSYIDNISDASRALDKYPAIIGDLQGPQVRVGDFKPLHVSRGDNVLLVYSEKYPVAEEKVLPVSSRRLFKLLEEGDILLLDDGRIRFRVEEVSMDRAVLTVLNDAIIYPRKTLIVIGKELDLPALTSRDIEAVKYALEKGFTHLALSYIRSPRDVTMLRDLLARLGSTYIDVIAKIETKKAFDNLEHIVPLADAIIIARGDLGMHFSLEKIPRLQKKIAEESIKQGKPVIIATQLLESMVNNPQPTRSEIVDVMNAVFDNVDAVLLTNETAVGKYPVEAVKWLAKIIREAEQWLFEKKATPPTRLKEPENPREKYAKGLVLLAESIGSKILVYTKTGSMPRRISKYRPQVPVYAGSNSGIIARKLSIHYGLNPIYISAEKQLDYEKGLDRLLAKLRELEEVNYGDTVLLTYGPRETLLNVIKILEVL